MKSKLKSLTSLFIIICMVTTLLPLRAQAAIFGTGNYEFSFDCQSYDDNLTVGNISINNNAMTSDDDRFQTDDGQYTIYVDITSANGEPTLSVNGNTPATISMDHNNENTYTFKILYDMASNNQNHLSVSPHTNNPANPNEDPNEPNNGNAANTEGTFTYTYEGEGADIFINGTMLPQRALNNESVRYNYNGSDTVALDVGTLFLDRLTELKVNNVDYSNQLPDTTEEMLNAFKDQRFFAHIQVPYADSYIITTKAVKTDPDHMVVGNFLWDRRTPSSEEEADDCLDHGDMELVSLKYNGNTYYPGDNIFVQGTAYDWSDHIITDEDPTGTTGGATLPAGAELTVKLIPEYGYQLVSFGPNGGGFTADSEDQSTFTFQVGKGSFHLSAHFEPVADTVDVNADSVESGNIEISNDEINTGSVVLSVNDVNLDDDKAEEFSKAAGDYEISQYLGIDLNQVIYKGTASDVWSNRIDELNKEATVTLQLSEEINADDIVIVHNIHDGDEYELINLESYDKETNTITFKTKSFSNYAIATKTNNITNVAVGSTSTNSGISTNPKTGDNMSSINIVLSVIAILSLGIVVMLENNKKTNK